MRWMPWRRATFARFISSGAEARFRHASQPKSCELGQLSECDPFVDPDDLTLSETCKSELSDVREPARARNFEIFRNFASRRQEKPRCCRIHFCLSPREARGGHRLEELVLERTRLVGAPGRQEATGTGKTVSIKA